MEVPAGDRLVIDVTNTDAEQVHDLVLDDGSHSRRLSPGDSARVDVEWSAATSPAGAPWRAIARGG